ncbi:MAG: polyphosphate polymerase domain-containing protein [Calditrichaeota bacterium]|nr:MAG: VTC domain-containing protein [Calditrichota bacterium]MBL1207033.1 polyphosphate polymerase domain-containing protein [Calditrichota bacterium]NOG46860.1 polyphosphate polymerase domain-containing protein [Calditrichota bacterium]
MASRYEYKYLVPNTLVDKLRSELKPYMELDGFAKKHSNGQYTVRSIYYDSPQFDCYKEKHDGIQIRNKYRIRGYDNHSEKSITFLEIKHKNTNCISKSRAPLYYTNVAKTLNSRRVDDYVLSFSGNGVEKNDARKFIYHYYTKNLRPAVLVIYDREAFLGKMDPSLRLTFDKNLRSVIYPDLEKLYKEDRVKYTFASHFIFEVKFFGNLPAWIKSLIAKHELKRQALSKYTMSLETHSEFSNRRLTRQNMIKSRECCYV